MVRKERRKECGRKKSRERTNDILITPSDRVTSQPRNIIDWAQGLLVSENILKFYVHFEGPPDFTMVFKWHRTENKNVKADT